MPKQTDDVTELLHRWREGDRAAGDELFGVVLPDLRRLAQYFLKRERPGHPLQPSDLVNTIFLRLLKIENRDWRTRQHFFAFFARAMRWAPDRYRQERPRGGIDRLGGPELFSPRRQPHVGTGNHDVQLLDELAGTRPDWCMVVEVKHYLGLTDEEGADALGIKLRSFQRMWRYAREWLFDRIEKGCSSRT